MVQPGPEAGAPGLPPGLHPPQVPPRPRGLPAGDAQGVAEERRGEAAAHHLEGAGEGSEEHSSGGRGTSCQLAGQTLLTESLTTGGGR